MRKLMWFMVGFTAVAALAFGMQLSAAECYDDYGKINVPKGQKLIMVPWWVKADELIAPVTPGKALPKGEGAPEPTPCVPEGELGYGPGTVICED